MATKFTFTLDSKTQPVSEIRSKNAQLANAIEELYNCNYGNKLFPGALDFFSKVLSKKYNGKKPAELEKITVIITASDDNGELGKVESNVNFFLTFAGMTLPKVTRRERVKGEKSEKKEETALEDLI